MFGLFDLVNAPVPSSGGNVEQTSTPEQFPQKSVGFNVFNPIKTQPDFDGFQERAFTVPSR